jgi:hypothetical protein
MGLFSKKPGPGNLEDDTSIPVQPSRNQEFHGTLADIKSSPKPNADGPDSRLESMNKKTFF